MAFTFQEFAIAWSQPLNKTRCTACWETTPCLAWSLPWQPSCCASWWLWSDGKKCCHVIIFMETLRKAGWSVFFGVSMAAWLHDLCQRWGGGQGLKGIITWGICLEEMLAQWTDNPMRWGQALGSEWYETRIALKKHKCSLDFDNETIVLCFVANLRVKKAHVFNFHIHTEMKNTPPPRTRTMRSHWKNFRDVLRLYLTRSYQKGYETWEVPQLHTWIN